MARTLGVRARWVVFAALSLIPAASDHSSSEADAAAKNYLAKRMVSCGGASYEWSLDSPRTVIQYRDLSYKVESRGLTDADKLNGYEWRGIIHLTFSVFRVAQQTTLGPRWSDWSDAGTLIGNHPRRDINLVKRNGQWFYDLMDLNRYEGEAVGPDNINHKRLECSQVPKG